MKKYPVSLITILFPCSSRAVPRLKLRSQGTMLESSERNNNFGVSRKKSYFLRFHMTKINKADF